MKQILVLASALTILVSAPTFASNCGCNKDLKSDCGSICEKVDKDNECYFDKQYAKLKKEVGFDCTQEKKIDCYYNDFKDKMSTLKHQMLREQKKLCAMIEKDECKSTIKEQKNTVKEIKKSMRNECKIFDKSVKSELCGDQKGKYRKFKRYENRKMRQLSKNCKVFRLPCISGCKITPKCDKCGKTYIPKEECGCNK